MTASFTRHAGLLLAGCLMLLTLGAAGCGGVKGDLFGKVSYQGKPLALGSVLIVATDSKPRTAGIEADGSYHFDDVPVGEAKLTIYSPDPAKQEETCLGFLPRTGILAIVSFGSRRPVSSSRVR
jgi:hypothetical protein